MTGLGLLVEVVVFQCRNVERQREQLEQAQVQVQVGERVAVVQCRT